MKRITIPLSAAVSAITLSSCGSSDPNRKPLPITIGYQTQAAGHTIAAGYSSTAGIAVNVSAK